MPEHHQDAVTAISGSGPAYIFYVVEAMIEAGVLLGLPRTTATELVVQTLYGAATMLRETGEHPTVLREQVLEPGRHDDGRAAPARRPQGARRVPDRDGGGARPLARAVVRLGLVRLVRPDRLVVGGRERGGVTRPLTTACASSDRRRRCARA